MMLGISVFSRNYQLTGLALGVGLALLGAPGCSSDDSAPAGSAGSAGSSMSTDGAGGGSAGSSASDSGSTKDSSGGETAMVFCAQPQRASDIGDHCDIDGGGQRRQPTTTCPMTPGDAAASGDGGEQYPGNHSGTFSDDDDCKYDVSYGINPCMDGGPSTINVNLKSRVLDADGGQQGVPGANPSIEAFLDETHPLPNKPKPVTTDLGKGDYRITGVPFDAEGQWTVRFHFFENCLETEPTSKHGHIAFTVIVQSQ